ncbi:MAG: exodeoxyribonuclease VII large subunit [Muribaculaceae bacterium]|nr:exodeoxyribonuclease VII large subunit [Muribaculaceae bacterium]
MNSLGYIPQQPQGMTLSEFNALIEAHINGQADIQNQWVIAETSDLRLNRSGHCYTELIEKDSKGVTVAKVDAAIWANNYAKLYYKFKEATGQVLASGMKVLVNVTANYHHLYGLKVKINDIDPNYTLGDMARQRQEIINRLTAEGIIDMNKELPWPEVPQRIAIISAEGAAGYGDFMNQLQGNSYGLQFYTCLFSAVMQGSQTVPTVLAALDHVNDHIDLFDCVVIIRGGGSTSDLNSFDNYDLASTVAQFPIPVIVGIGHERDVTVLDYVAAMRVKTPTAAAEWLIQRGTTALARLNELQDAVVTSVRDTVAQAREQLAYFTSMIPATARRIIDTNRVRLDNHAKNIPFAAANLIMGQRTRLERIVERMGDIVTGAMQREQQRLQALNDKATLLSPVNTLRRGYSLVKLGDKYVTSTDQLAPSDKVTLQFANGTAAATVTNIPNSKE